MRTKIAIPMGDPAGVGPEIVVKTAVIMVFFKAIQFKS